MIEKLDTIKDIDNIFDRNGLITTVPNGVAIINKINEIINVLNAIVVDTKDGTFIDGSKKAEPVDKFAEQRKWVGKLCKFWDITDYNDYEYGILNEIDENRIYPYVSNCVHYMCCEPVSEDLIYKGE